MNRIVKALLVKRGIKQKDLAEELGVLLSTVSGVINGHHSSKRIKKHIAEKLDKPYEKLWGKPK
jgi:transcriptional regulator with XRE-family HTH domain